MERLVRKYGQSYRRAREEMNSWSTLHFRLVKQFGNAAAIVERLPVLMDKNNYGVLGEDKSISMVKDLPAAQAESFELLLKAIASTLAELDRVWRALEKISQDGRQLLRAERQQPTAQQLRQRVGPRPSIQDCIDGLQTIFQMHHDEFCFKTVLVSVLSYDSTPEDLAVLKSLLEGQPNIPSDGVQHILDLVSAGETS